MQSFTAFVESLLKDKPTDLESAQRYQKFIAEGKPQIQGCGSRQAGEVLGVAVT